MVINKLLHVYWAGSSLSWLRYLTIISFKKYNPDWEVKLHLPEMESTQRNTWNTPEQSKKYTGEDWTPKLKEIVNYIEYHNMNKFGKPNDMPEVIKSDIIRNYVIYRDGGIWSDMDIIYLKPIPESLLDCDALVCEEHKHYSIGFIGGVPNNKFYKEVYEIQKDFNGCNTDYQGMGATFLRVRYQDFDTLQSKFPDTKFNNLPMSYFYSIRWNELHKLYNENIELHEEVVGIHFFAGSPFTTHWEEQINQKTYKEGNTTIYNIIKEVMK